MKHLNILSIVGILAITTFSACTPLSDCFDCQTKYYTYQWDQSQKERDSSFVVISDNKFCNVERSKVVEYIETNKDTIKVKRYFDGNNIPVVDYFAKSPDCVRRIAKKK